MANTYNARSKAAVEIANLCKNAFSYTAYRSYAACAAGLLNLGYDAKQVTEILYSKLSRWARDAEPKSYRYGKYPAKTLVKYIKDNPGAVLSLFHAVWNSRDGYIYHRLTQEAK